MARAEVRQQTTQLDSKSGSAKNEVKSLTYDENVLPTPQELEAYKAVDPRIIDFLLDTAKKEQLFRHSLEETKVDIIKRSDSGNRRMDWWGMFFAMISLLALIGLSAYALYVDRPWFVGIFGGSTFVAIVYIFVKRENISQDKKTDKQK